MPDAYSCAAGEHRNSLPLFSSSKKNAAKTSRNSFAFYEVFEDPGVTLTYVIVQERQVRNFTTVHVRYVCVTNKSS